jgi:hypothetical protein
MRTRRLLVAIPVLILWAIAVLTLALSEDLFVYAFGGAIVTIGVGALLSSWWALAAPTAVAAALIVPLAVTDDEGFGLYDDTYGALITTAIVFFVVPATAALAVGILVRRRAGRERPAPPRSPRRAPPAP